MSAREITAPDATEEQARLAGEITTRLRRVEGQIRGILRMLDEGRDCEDMMTQAMAVRSAIDLVGSRLMQYHLERCLLEGFDCDEERMTRLREALRLWTRFGQPAPAMALPYEPEG
jgi:DNA-binding FrmR family transcriptional regulator